MYIGQKTEIGGNSEEDVSVKTTALTLFVLKIQYSVFGRLYLVQFCFFVLQKILFLVPVVK